MVLLVRHNMVVSFLIRMGIFILALNLLGEKSLPLVHICQMIRYIGQKFVIIGLNEMWET